MANNVKITGIDKTVANLRKLGATPKGSVLKGAVYLRGVVATYPPRRIPSKYVRTHNLGHRWTVKSLSDVRALVGNNAAYARYVMDDVFQTRIMKLRDWLTVQTHAQRERKEVIRIIDADLKAQIRQMWARRQR